MLKIRRCATFLEHQFAPPYVLSLDDITSSSFVLSVLYLYFLRSWFTSIRIYCYTGNPSFVQEKLGSAHVELTKLEENSGMEIMISSTVDKAKLSNSKVGFFVGKSYSHLSLIEDVGSWKVGEYFHHLTKKMTNTTGTGQSTPRK